MGECLAGQVRTRGWVGHGPKDRINALYNEYAATCYDKIKPTAFDDPDHPDGSRTMYTYTGAEPRNGCPVNYVSEIRIPLYPIFSEEFQSGRAAGACFNFVCESLDKIPGIVEFGSPQHLQRIELEAIRDRILRIEQDQDANWKADYEDATGERGK
jgi:hypothetical protein